MASTSTTQRLLRELKDYTKSPNEALLHLGPVNEDDLLHWEAVLKGVKGTPYEGELINSAAGRRTATDSISLSHSTGIPFLRHHISCLPQQC
jgi:hypothetical protein